MTIQAVDSHGQGKKGMTIAFASFLVPFLIFIVLFITPFGSTAFYSPMTHSLLLLATCVIAFYTAAVAYHAYLESKSVRLLVISSSFTIFGIGFFMHALALPFLSIFSEIVFDVTEHSGLLFGSIVFFGLFLPIYGAVDTVYKSRVAILSYIILFTITWFSAIIFFPVFSDFVEGLIPVIIVATALFFLVSSLLLVKKYDEKETVLTRYLIIGFSILVNSAIIPLFYTEWALSWWYFHLVFLAGFGAILAGLIKSRESEEELEAVFHTEDVRSKISTKIIVLVVALMTLTTITLSSMISRYVTSTIQKSVGDTQLHMAQETMRNIDHMLYERSVDVQVLAGSVVLGKTPVAGALADLQYRLDGFRSVSDSWDSLTLFDKSGKVVTSSGRITDGMGKGSAEEDTFTRALAGQVAYSDLVQSNTVASTVYFAAPVRSSAAKEAPITGVIVGQAAWSVIESEFARVAGQGVHVHLFNKGELMIATNGDQAELFNSDARFIHNAALSESSAISLMQKSNEGTFTALISQAPELGYKRYRGNGWEMLIESPASIVFADVSYVVEKIITILAALIAVAALIVLIVLYQLVFVPARTLSEALAYIAEHGDLVRVPVETNDEMGTLARAFNKMVETLSKAQAENIKKSEKLEQ